MERFSIADDAALHSPYSLGDAALGNRFVMAPMTRQFSPSGVPGSDVAEYYRRRASHFGLIVTEGTLIDHPSAGTSDRVPHLYGEAALAGWMKVTAAVHGDGGRIAAQLWHLGAARSAGAPPYRDAPVLTPSGIGLDGSPTGVSASTTDIDNVIASFVRAAVNAKMVGFDAVEIHGAHGYLLDQFQWSQTNRRIDGYGGSLAARMRLSAEVVAAVRDAVGPNFPVIFRFSQWKASDFDARVVESAAQLDSFLQPLAAAGVSAFHVSTRRYWLPAFDGDRRTLAGWTKHLTGLTTIALGSVGVSAPFGQSSDTPPSLSLEPLLELFERDEFDLVALGRAALAEPEWPTKVATGRHSEIRAYTKARESELV